MDKYHVWMELHTLKFLWTNSETANLSSFTGPVHITVYLKEGFQTRKLKTLHRVQIDTLTNRVSVALGD